MKGKKMKVELQDNARRRKGGYLSSEGRNETCFNCGKVGHYSRNCRSNRRTPHPMKNACLAMTMTATGTGGTGRGGSTAGVRAATVGGGGVTGWVGRQEAEGEEGEEAQVET